MVIFYRIWLLLGWIMCLAEGLAYENDTLLLEGPTRMPGNDEWYRAPKGFENEAPGTILKYRRVPRGLAINNKDRLKIKDAWQILFRTRNINNTPESTVVTVAIPNNYDPKKIFMYHWFSDAGFSDCIPSLGMQVGTRQDNTYTQIQNAIIIIAMNQGWVTAVVDDGGSSGLFATSTSAGYRNLDAIRAIRKSNSFTFLAPDAKLVTYGYSGGAFGGELMTELQPTYAPDVKIDGVALGGLIPNISYLLTWPKINRTSYAPPTLLSLAKEYKNMSTWLDGALKPELKDTFYKSNTQCYDSNWEIFAGKRLGQFFTKGIEALEEPIPASVIEQGSWMGSGGIPKVPMYIYETVGDEVSNVDVTDRLIKRYCENGANILYERNPRLLNHSTEMIEGMPGAIRFASDILEGKPGPQGCKQVKESEYSLRGARQGLTFTGILGIGLAFMGMPVGPSMFTNWITQFPE